MNPPVRNTCHSLETHVMNPPLETHVMNPPRNFDDSSKKRIKNNDFHPEMYKKKAL
jgi:hypothetical protein